MISKQYHKEAMKKNLFISIIAMVSMLSGCEQATETGMITIDVEKSYPKKELSINDLWEVEYVALETDTTFLVAGGQPWHVGENKLGFVDNRTGSLLFFDAKTGKKAFCINRKGAGPQEYKSVGALVMDEKAGEVFAWSIFDGTFQVYDEQGNYLRTLQMHNRRKDEYSYITNFINLDDANLLCSSNNMKGYATHYLLNKKSGQTVLIDSISNERYVSEYIFAQKDGVTYSTAPSLTPFIHTSEGLMYADHSNDTLYRMTDKMTPSPFIVRTPRVKETEPNKILRFDNETDDWMFLSGIEMAYDFSKNEGLHQTNYGVEKASGGIYELKFIHPDYEGKEYSPTALNARYYPADELLTALEEGKLKGKLKEIASTLDEEDNGVVMLLKRKGNGQN